MRIGLNLLYLIPGVVGGTETYAAGLLHGLAQIDKQNEYFVFVNREAAEWPLPDLKNFTRIVCPINAASRPRRYLYEQTRLPHLLKRYRIDLVHSLGYVAPLFFSCPSVVTVLDLNYHAFGSRMPLAKQLALRLFVKQSARRADHIITISNFARGQMTSILGIKPEKVTVTLLAASPAAAQTMDKQSVLYKNGIKRPYIVAFSSASPHKNIPRLLQAFALARQKYKLPHQLVLIGHRSTDTLQQTGMNMNNVVWTGYVEESIKQVLLAEAEMLVFPSTYEGFGLPILEAQQAGVPVVCSTAASLPEVAGEAAIYFDPLSVDEMANSIRQCLSDKTLYKDLCRRGIENLLKFSWEKTARTTLAVYKEAAEGP